MLKSKIKVEEMCRTCLTKDSVKFYSVFDEVLGAETLGSVISSVTGIRFEPGDGLPTTVCGSCKAKATIAYHYKCQSLQADEALRSDVTVKVEDPATDRVLFEQDQAGPSQVKEENDTPPDPPDDSMDLETNLFGSNDGEAPASYDGEAPTNQGASEDNSTYCPVCGENYEDAAGLTSHMWRFHPDIMGPKKRGRPKQLLTSAILKKMLESGRQVSVRRHSCALCQVDTSSAEDLALHMTQHKDDKLLRCAQCRKMFVQRENFDQHSCGNRSDQHQQENEMTVDGHPATEAERTATEVPLGDLLRSNDPESVLQVCFTCGGVFLSAAELSDHRDTDHPDLSLRCGYCHKVFASLRGAARHRDSCALVERLFSCDTCGAKFQHEISLNKHILRHHAGHPVSISFNTTPGTSGGSAVVLQCDTCKRIFRRKDLLVKHIQLHQPCDKYFECDICRKKFHRRNNLRSHMRTHEPRATPSASRACLCLYCGHGFSNSSNLIVHMRRHTGEKPYKCDFCGKGFPRSSDLQCHRRSHTGEKPCVCVVCGKADVREDERDFDGFSRSNKLSRHMRVHTGLKPYSCLYCDKKFSQSNDLTLHVRRHTGHKPYGCEVCGDRFIHGAALHHHQRFHNHFPDPDMMRGGHQVAPVSANDSLPFTLTLAN